MSYLGPGVAAFRYASLEAQTLRPKLAPLPLLDQVQAAFPDAAGWQAEFSDKGIYVQQSLSLFESDGELLTALAGDRAQLLTVFTFDDRRALGWKLNDGRRYLTFEDLRAVASSIDAGPVIVELEQAGVLNRGLVLACSRCRAKSFYFLADVGDQFSCPRCRLRQQLTQAGWMGGDEPPWRYGLAEVVFQFLKHDGDLPLLGAYGFARTLGAGRARGDQRKLQITSELDVFSPDGTRSELDIVVADGHELWVGEATTQRRLETSGAAELERLERLRSIADVLRARGVVLITSAAWNAATLGRARATFPSLWPQLEVIEGASRAPRWAPAPVQESLEALDPAGTDSRTAE